MSQVSPPSVVVPCACKADQPFCPLPESLRMAFDSVKATVAFKKGEAIFRESEPCDAVFLVLQGRVRLSTTSRDGKALLLRFAEPGEMLGVAEAVLGGAPYDCSAVAAEPSVVELVARERFFRFIVSYPEAQLRLTVVLSEQYKAAQRETKFLAFGGTSTSRLSRLLLDWSAADGEIAADGIHIATRLTHTDLAQTIGATRETVTRILSDMHQRGIVERRSNEILIHKANELARLSTY